ATGMGQLQSQHQLARSTAKSRFLQVRSPDRFDEPGIVFPVGSIYPKLFCVVAPLFANSRCFTPYYYRPSARETQVPQQRAVRWPYIKSPVKSFHRMNQAGVAGDKRTNPDRPE